MFGRAIHGNTWRGDATYRETLYCESRPTTAGCAGGVIAMTKSLAAEGARYIVGPNATGSWAGKDGAVAIKRAGPDQWSFEYLLEKFIKSDMLK
jgi:hypothetical protein